MFWFVEIIGWGRVDNEGGGGWEMLGECGIGVCMGGDM